MGRFENKAVLITGAGSGMGEAHARSFAAEGAFVLVSDIDLPAAQNVAASIGEQATAMELDVADAQSWQAVIDHVRRVYGRLDVLVNNAALVMRRSIDATTPEDFRRILDVNATGAFLGIQASAPLMIAGGGGSIINISSTSGVAGFPDLVAYGTSKWAVRGLTKMAAVEFASDGVRVNAVIPGLVETPMTQGLNRQGGSLRGYPATPSEVSSVVMFLASDESSFITGADFTVDGGETAASRAIELNAMKGAHVGE